MAGIKQIYRSIDTWRIPEFDSAISYPPNSFVALLDSDAGYYRHYISITQTEPNSLEDSERPFKRDWVVVSFDSDTLLKYANEAVLGNFNSLTSSVYQRVDSDLQITLARIDSEHDSDFAEMKTYLDSELNIFRSDYDSDHSYIINHLDSELTIVNLRIDENLYGRVWPNASYLADYNEQRLTNLAQVGGLDNQITADFYDLTQQITVNFQATTNNVYGSQYGLHTHFAAGHRINGSILDSEFLSVTFAAPVYVDTFSFEGVRDDLGPDYFSSASATFIYDDLSTATVNQIRAVSDNEQRMQLTNPNPLKRVTDIDITAFNRIGLNPGINRIAVNSLYSVNELRSEDASYQVFANVQNMLNYTAHNDVIAFVEDCRAMFVGHDSEWVSVDPRYQFVDISLNNLEANFPAFGKPDGLKGFATITGYEYYTLNNEWVVDSDSMMDDSDRNSSIDSDLAVLKEKWFRLDSDFQVYQTVFNNEYFTAVYQDQDSEIAIIKQAFNTFYKEFVSLRQEHLSTQRMVDSDVPDLKSKYTIMLSSLDSDLSIIRKDNDSDLNSIPTRIALATAAALSTLRIDHDSDKDELESQIAAAFDAIALLRQGEVADNDSDIRVLERRVTENDSDIAYSDLWTMKYRGFIDQRTDIPLNSKRGDVFQTQYPGFTGKTNLPGLDSEYLDVHTFIIFDDSDNWTILGSNGNAASSNDIEVTAGFPVGTILTFASKDKIPSSFRYCDGSFYDISIYPELFATLGKDTLPDLRNMFLRGWNQDSDGFHTPRPVLSYQADEIKQHTHTFNYTDVSPGGTTGLLDGSTDNAYDTSRTDIRSGTTNVQFPNALETRPRNVAVVFAIAMYSGAGAQWPGDSDVLDRLNSHDSDLRAVIAKRDDLDSDYSVLRIDFDSEAVVLTNRDSDNKKELQIQITDNDSDIAKLRVDLEAIAAVSNTAHISTPRLVSVEGTMTANIPYDITAEVFGGGLPENYCFPQVTVYYNSGTPGANPDKAGRILNGRKGTPNYDIGVIHTDFGATNTVFFTPDSDIAHDIRIVSTFRTT